jgi:hypothetical protein
MFRCFALTVALGLAIPGQSTATVNIWLSAIGTAGPGSAFPPTASAVSIFEPYVGGSGTVYIWGRPDAGASLENMSLNLYSDSAGTIQFTSATMHNELPPVTRFQFVDDSSASPPLPIAADRVDGITGVTISTGSADGLGSFSDPLYSPPNNSWLIAEVDYDVLATGENTETRLFLEIGGIGMNHLGDSTDECYVIFGDATDTPPLNAEDNRGEPSANFDALIRPRVLPGDADRNGAVEPADYTIWKAAFASTNQLAADHNGNSIVDAADYIIWRQNLGLSAGFGGALAIPEPSAAVAALVAMAAFLTASRVSIVNVPRTTRPLRLRASSRFCEVGHRF